ncbi:MAG: glycosyltransferase family 4 protein [Eubacteriales bacterium]|nr:glycosyltransferase family 4 protein [Eubacteriales bacterium]
MEKRDILFLCQFFYPDQNSSATLPFDTACSLASHGFTVDALVGYPKEYTEGSDIPLRETVRGVGIRRVRYLQLGRSGTLGRLINYFSLTFHMLLRLRVLKRYRCVFVYSNPPVLPLVPILAKRRFGTDFVFVAYDVYPEVAYASGTLSADSSITRVMVRLNHALYRNAGAVVALTDEMRAFLLAHRPELDAERIVTIANWAHERRRIPDTDAYARFGYPDGQFVVSYFGNMGTCQDMETLLGAAAMLREDKRVRFLIVGHGNKKQAVAERIAAEGLDNVQLLDFLTGKDFEQAVAVSSCAVVSLEKGLMGTCAPSKYYSYLQGGMPVLAVVEKESYLAAELARERIGYAVEIGDAAGLRDAILALAEHPERRRQMGERAGALYETRYAYEVAMEKYRELAERLLRR